MYVTNKIWFDLIWEVDLFQFQHYIFWWEIKPLVNVCNDSVIERQSPVSACTFMLTIVCPISCLVWYQKKKLSCFSWSILNVELLDFLAKHLWCRALFPPAFLRVGQKHTHFVEKAQINLSSFCFFFILKNTLQCHRTGLPKGPEVWSKSWPTLQEIIDSWMKSEPSCANVTEFYATQCQQR